MRQHVVSTAISYFRRFFVETSYIECDPILVALACMLIAFKTCEAPLSRDVIIKMFQLSDAHRNCPYSLAKIVEAEHFVWHGLNFHTFHVHPYESLCALREDIEREHTDKRAELQVVIDGAWKIINDSYFGSTFLSWPPHVIALTALYLSASTETSMETDFVLDWMKNVGKNVTKIEKVARELLSTFSLMKEVLCDKVNEDYKSAAQRVENVWKTERDVAIQDKAAFAHVVRAKYPPKSSRGRERKSLRS
eukprot:TRINITY_DN1148_c0_g1_i5.p1 TRINITY_DN1148_c0_g1~~TRINITY_DN1148_c0_g1_i5.p1  ORF type:complete len:250 (-),score=52.67 TRINITY_DN1148_c0_g1_i5:94-843(-)